MGVILNKSIRTFRAWSNSYDNGLWSGYFERCYKEVLALSSSFIRPDARVLDIGCGTGKLLNYLSNLTDGEIVGIDSTPEMITRAYIRNNRRNMTIINCSLEDYSSLKKFDIIYCLNVFHHFENQKEAVYKMNFLLRPNGLLILLDPFRDNIFRLSWEYLSKYFIFREPYIKYFKKKELLKLVSNGGFKLLHTKIFLYVILISIWQKNAVSENQH